MSLLEAFRYIGIISKELVFNALLIRKPFIDRRVDINGQVVVITGANTGIGKVTARELARRGAKVYIGCRDLDKGKKAIEEIKSEYSNADIRLIRLDLSSLASVRQFAAQLCEHEPKIDRLINNAGIAFHPKARTEDGFEMHFGVNYLGHFLLTHLLLEPLKEAPNARIVNVTSEMYMNGAIDFLDINSEKKRYKASNAYAQSKLAIILFTKELAHRLAHTNVTTYCLHPGFVRTDIIKQPNVFTRIFLKIFAIDAERGARTTLHCTLEPSLSSESGHYYSDCTRVDNVFENAKDGGVAGRLWQLSNHMVGLEDHLKI